MDHLQRLRIFTRVAETMSFSRTAEQLGVPKPTVTLAVQELEARLQARLLYRTTRRVALTDEGTLYYERCSRILAEVEEADALFAKRGGRLRGTVRLDVPERFGTMVVLPSLPAFVRDYPELEVVLSCTDRFIDLVDSGVDCIVRIGALADSTMSVRRLGLMAQVNVVSRGYADRYGIPKTLDDLGEHTSVGYHVASSPGDHDFEYVEGGVVKRVPMRGNVSVTSSTAYRAACEAGLGLIQAPRHGLIEDIRAGRLVEVLPEYQAAPMPVSILHAQGRRLAPRVKVVIDWLVTLFQPTIASA